MSLNAALAARGFTHDAASAVVAERDGVVARLPIVPLTEVLIETDERSSVPLGDLKAPARIISAPIEAIGAR